MSLLQKTLQSRYLNTRYLTFAVSRQHNLLRCAASVGALLTLIGLFIAETDLPWYLGVLAVVLAAASVVVTQPLVPVGYAVCSLVLWLVCAPRGVSVAALVAALGFVLWHGALSMAGSVPMRGRLATATLRRWAKRLGITAAAVIAAFAVAAVLDDPKRPPSFAAVVIACLLVLIVLTGALVIARRRRDPGASTD